jgi:hypothetical protein
VPSMAPAAVPTTQVLQQRAVNFDAVAGAEVSLLVLAKSAKDSGLPTQSRFGSNVRRNTDGWFKRSVGKENKVSSESMTVCVPWLQELLITDSSVIALVKTCASIVLDPAVAPLRVRSCP